MFRKSQKNLQYFTVICKFYLSRGKELIGTNNLLKSIRIFLLKYRENKQKFVFALTKSMHRLIDYVKKYIQISEMHFPPNYTGSNLLIRVLFPR